LFTEPLVGEAGWLLPLGLLGIPLTLLILRWQWPPSDKHLAVVLWAGWLLPSLAYLSFTSGLFHAYYLIMVGAPLAALVGATAWALQELCRQRSWLGWALVAVLTAATLTFQVTTVQAYRAYAGLVSTASLGLWLGGLALLARRRSAGASRVALALVFAGLMVAPLVWSGLTAINPNPDVALPRSGPGSEQAARPAVSGTISAQQEAVAEHLLANTEPDDYLVATLTATEAAPYILATGRPVLTFGGFRGDDDVVDVERLQEMVAGAELRFVLGSGLERDKPEIADWLEANCSTVALPVLGGLRLGEAAFGPARAAQAGALYDCASAGPAVG
jgi:4-amino-4-deoxy-L-arabinose transferase-like glycosyltransferase